MTALYVLAQEHRAALEKLLSLDLDEQVVADTLESLSGDLEQKAISTAMFARNIEALASSIKEAEMGMAARRKALENRAERLQAYLLDSMNLAGIRKIESPYFCLSIKANPAAVVISAPDLIPDEFMTTPEPPPPAPDKKKIKAALQSSIDVPGASLKKGERLEIK